MIKLFINIFDIYVQKGTVFFSELEISTLTMNFRSQDFFQKGVKKQTFKTHPPMKVKSFCYGLEVDD